MRVRKDLLFLTTLGLVIVLAILYISSHLILLNSFENLDEQRSTKDLQLVLTQLSEDQAKLDTLAVDFADWNDTIAFIAGQLKDYPATNFTDQTFQYLQLNLVLIIDPAGHIVYGSGYDLASGKSNPVPASLLNHIKPGDKLIGHTTLDSSVTGIILLPEGPLIVASRPILTSDYKGPIRGTLVLGHFLSAGDIEVIDKITGVTLSFQRVNDPHLPSDFMTARDNLSRLSSPYVHPLNDTTMAGYSMVPDLYGESALLFRVEGSRDIYQQGLANLNSLFSWFAAISFLFSIGVYIVLDRMTIVYQARHVAEDRYQSIFENTLEGIYQSSPDGRFIRVNPAMAHIFGYSSPKEMTESLRNITNQFYVEPEDRKQYVQLLETTGRISNFTRRFYHKDGYILWGSTSARIVRDSVGNILYYEGFLQDVTESQMAEEILKNSEQRFRALIENGLDNISLIAADGTLLWESPAVFRTLGYIPDQFVQQNILELVHPDDAEWARNVLGRLIREPEIRQTGIFRLQHQDGSWRWIEAIATNLLSDMNVQAIVINYREITERKWAEEALLESEGRFRSYIEHAPLGVFVIDSSGCFAGMNPATTQLLGYSEAELMGVSILKVLPPQLAGMGQQLFERVVAEGAINAEFPVLRKDGRMFWILAHAVKLDSIRVLAFCQDTTERKRANEKIERQVERFKALSEIDYSISSSFDLQLNLNTLLSHVNAQLGIDASDVLLLNSNTQMLEYAAGRGFHTQAVEHTRMHFGEGYAGRAAQDQKPTWILNLADHPTMFLGAPRLEGEDFISYYAVPLLAKGKTEGVLEIFHRAPLSPDEEWLNFLNALAGQAAIAIDNAMLFDSLQRSNTELALAYEATMEGWSRALDLRDKETEGHTRRVADMTVIMARAFGMHEEEIVHLRQGALLHDIGKMGVPDEILLKPGPLTDEEWVIMKKHPTFAYHMLSPIAYLRPALDIPYCHHEKWDGSGYPRGLQGTQIPLAARLFAIVDVWDALRSNRPYRASWPEEKVRAHISALAGTHFDPEIVEKFLEINLEIPAGLSE